MLDVEIQRDVLDELLWDESIDPAHIIVATDGGQVTLSGRTATYREKWNAGADAGRVTGVRAVVNRIEVDTAAERVLDADLAASARAGIDANGLVPKGSVTVSVNDGWVTMTGNVRHHFQRQAAEHVVRHVRGLQGFSDLVTVAREPARDVTKNITASLRRNAALDADKIKVSDIDGAVTLTGSVHAFAERQEAERAAWRAAGVVSVANELVVAN